MSQWTRILTAAELDTLFALTAKLDPRFARQQREWYEARTVQELRSHMNGAWNANDSDGYQMARSFIALKEAA
jgi:hypothetical protein